MPRLNCEKRGALLTTVGLIVLVIALMVLISIPGVRRTRAELRRSVCVENLAVILAAKERYALDHDLKANAAVAMSDLLKEKKLIRVDQTLQEEPVCPNGGKYSVNPLGALPTCSFGHQHKLEPLGKSNSQESK